MLKADKESSKNLKSYATIFYCAALQIKIYFENQQDRKSNPYYNTTMSIYN